jgi:ABC-2 type transport system permease protein
MFGHIIRHEWRVLRADATVWVVGAVFGVAIAYAMANGVHWTEFQHLAHRQAAQEEAERYQRMRVQIGTLEHTHTPVAAFGDPRNPTMFGSRFGPRYAILPPGPLAPLAIGQSDLVPSYFRVSTDARETVVAAAELENPQRLLVGRFDLAFALVYLYPLLILAVAHNLLSAEREEGTLALALSQPVSLAALVRGKVAVRALLLVGVVVLFSLAALVVGRVALGEPGVAARLGLWMAVVLAYGGFWFALAALVSSLGRSSAANATILATAWLTLVVLLPSLFNLVATTIYPVPSRVEMIQAMRVASDDASAAGSTLLARYYEDHPELASDGAEQAMTDFNVVRVAVDEDVARRVRPVIARYEEQIAQQQRIIDRLRILSPAILMQDALNDVAGTGTARHQHFLAQVDRFHARWRAYIVPLIFQKTRVTSFDTVPSFAYEEEHTANVAARVGFDATVMLIVSAVLTAVGLRRLRRYPVVG